MTGAITQAIEALEYIELAGPDGSWKAKEALEVLKAFRDGVPELPECKEEFIMIGMESKEETEYIKAKIRIAQHLQDGVK